ncbi:MAG: putative addiction module component [Bacteroidota bacterium]|jgi:putative addiction module component (TIGR02574 family)
MTYKVIHDQSGNPGMFIPMNEWEEFVAQHPDLSTAKMDVEIPEWQKTIIDERLKEYEQNPSNVLSWEQVKSAIKRK